MNGAAPTEGAALAALLQNPGFALPDGHAITVLPHPSRVLLCTHPVGGALGAGDTVDEALANLRQALDYRARLLAGKAARE